MSVGLSLKHAVPVGVLSEQRRRFSDGGLPVGGTADQQTLGGIDMTVRRNAFGGQLESFETDLDVPALGGPPVHAAFIRAPSIERLGPGVRALATLPDGRIVAVEQDALIGTAFHPEVTGETRFHQRFLNAVIARVSEPASSKGTGAAGDH